MVCHFPHLVIQVVEQVWGESYRVLMLTMLSWECLVDIQGGERPGLDSVAMTGHLQQWDWMSNDCPEWIPGALHREIEKIQGGRRNLEEVVSGKSKEDHVSRSRVKCCRDIQMLL